MGNPLRIDMPEEEMAARRRLVDACHALANDRAVVHLFADSPFYCRLAGIPVGELYRSPEAMLRAQLVGWKRILEAVDCDVPGPAVKLDFGTCLAASIYGCELVEQAGSTPGFKPWFASESDLETLDRIDPRTNGLRAQELATYRWYRDHAEDFPVAFAGGEPFYPAAHVRLGTACEGPLSIACMIAGADRVLLWCHDRPGLVSRMVALITEKESQRLEHAFAVMGEPGGEITLADDYCPYVSLPMYKELILPHQQRLRDAFGPSIRFHSCIPDPRLLRPWRDELRISLFNGFKPQGGLASLRRDYQPVADVLGGRMVLESDIDGANVMVASAARLRRAATDWLEVLGPFSGAKLGATLSGGHRPDDLAKVGALKAAVLEAAGGASAPGANLV
ncbi:MAG: hypothetical protein ACLF0G_08880 [Candidatus Brocadiia bacterium]